MILHLLGSNGAGKSTLVRAVMRDYLLQDPVMVDGRQKPLYYRCFTRRHSIEKINTLTVVGHYDIECGGADTIKHWSTVMDVVEAAVARGDNVLLEGPTGREHRLQGMAAEIRVVWLQPALTTCVRGVQARGAKINAERITRSLNRCGRIAGEYAELGTKVATYEDRTEALHAVQSIIRSAT